MFWRNIWLLIIQRKYSPGKNSISTKPVHWKRCVIGWSKQRSWRAKIKLIILGRTVRVFWLRQTDRHLVGKPDQHPQHPLRNNLLLDGKRTLGYATNYKYIVYVLISEQLEVHFDIDAFEHISFLFKSARLNLIKLDFSYRNMMIIFLSFCLWNMWIFEGFYFYFITKLNHILWKGQPVFLCFCTFFVFAFCCYVPCVYEELNDKLRVLLSILLFKCYFKFV